MNDPIHYDIGKNEFENKQYEIAIDYLSRAIKLNPEFIDAYKLRAICYYRTSQLEKLHDDLDALKNLETEDLIYLLILDMLADLK